MRSVRGIALVVGFFLLVLVAKNIIRSTDKHLTASQEQAILEAQTQEIKLLREKNDLLSKKVAQLEKIADEHSDRIEHLDLEIHLVHKECTTPSTPRVEQTGQKPANWLELNDINLKKAAQDFGAWLKTNGSWSDWKKLNPPPNK